MDTFTKASDVEGTYTKYRINNTYPCFYGIKNVNIIYITNKPSLFIIICIAVISFICSYLKNVIIEL